MFTYIFKRLIGSIPVIILISLLVFMLVQFAPGDTADLLLSEEATPEDISAARERWGLNQPIYIQYWKFLIAALQGDLGVSFRYADPVLTMIGDRLPATIELAFFAILIAVFFGVPLGVWAGARPNSWVDNIGSFFGFFVLDKRTACCSILLCILDGIFHTQVGSIGCSATACARDINENVTFPVAANK